jgi:hypothetical protein
MAIRPSTTVALSWDSNAEALLATLGGSLACFLAFFLYLVGASRNEVRLARACIVATRVVSLLWAGSYAVQLHYDMKLVRERLAGSSVGGLGGREIGVSLPDLVLVRPVLGLIAALVSGFINTHHAFRWATIGVALALAGLDVAVAAQLDVQVSCHRAGTCLRQVGLPLEDLVVLLYRQYAGIGLAVWTALGAAVVNGVIGPCGPRYPVRLFSVTQTLEQITHRARGKRQADDADEVGEAAKGKAHGHAKAGGMLRARFQAAGRILWGAMKDYVEDKLSGR